MEYCHFDGIRRTVALKERNPDLKVLFSVGGWTAGGWVFSQMAETAERRRMFTASVLHFLTYFGLDGMDLDWEMPGYDMYGGQPTNPEVCELLMFLSLNKTNKIYLTELWKPGMIIISCG